ncbi:hypothetical protein FF38_01875 [Lucilia cuprina]|uniref:Uncharacterized protein n=1 Tax=Lucilia cuprina TaxID=7375 RepID=A0A0L0BQ85_LUCCU|nr:hypothetical protein FF38_01875 [Lucilia cuprina]
MISPYMQIAYSPQQNEVEERYNITLVEKMMSRLLNCGLGISRTSVHLKSLDVRLKLFVACNGCALVELTASSPLPINALHSLFRYQLYIPEWSDTNMSLTLHLNMMDMFPKKQLTIVVIGGEGVIVEIDESKIGRRGFSHHLLLLEEAFVDPVSRQHINTIDGLWRHLKISIPQRFMEFCKFAGIMYNPINLLDEDEDRRIELIANGDEDIMPSDIPDSSDSEDDVPSILFGHDPTEHEPTIGNERDTCNETDSLQIEIDPDISPKQSTDDPLLKINTQRKLIA